MNFVTLRGAMGSMPREKYLELYGLLTAGFPIKVGTTIPDEIKIVYIHSLIAGMEESFCLLRDMKNAGEIILAVDGCGESADSAPAMDAEGMRGSLFTHLWNIEQREKAIEDNKAE